MILQFFFIKEREDFGKNSTELVQEHDVKNVIEKLEKIYFGFKNIKNNGHM